MTGDRRHAAILVAALLAAAHPPASNAAQAAAPAPNPETCAACHGPRGVSLNPAMPSLAAQPKQFISTQLVMFREGRRKDPVMSAFAANLTNGDINTLADYFSQQPLPPPPRPPDPKLAEPAKRLAEQYHCVECHTPTLHGQQHIPRLAGQQREYLLAQLRGFRAGTRFDMDGNMTAAVQGMSDPEAAILADYLSALH